MIMPSFAPLIAFAWGAYLLGFFTVPVIFTAVYLWWALTWGNPTGRKPRSLDFPPTDHHE